MPGKGVVLSLTLLVLGAGVLGLTWVGRRSEDRSASPPSADLAHPSVISTASEDYAFKAIVEELKGLRADLASSAREITSRVPAAAAPANNTDLVAALKDLTAALRERLQSQGGNGRPQVLVPSATGLADHDALASADHKTLSPAHLFWTLPQIVERYGPPARVYEAGGELYVEYRGSNAQADPTEFHLHDGFVISVK